MDTADRPIVLASNRGPLSYKDEGGTLVPVRGGGGLVSGLAPLMDEGRITWIASALSDADRKAAADDLPAAQGQPVHLVDVPPDEFDRYYDVIANQTLWFMHHGLFDLTREPELDAAWRECWDAYKDVNRRFAAAIAAHAPEDAVVLVQDYHLTMVAPTVRVSRDDLSLVHFHHTPFAGPVGARVMATEPLV